MNNSKPLDILIELSKEKLEASGRKLAQASANKRQSQDQLKALSDYYTDYSQKLLNTSINGISPASYQNFRKFIYSLNEAISQQRQIIHRLDESLNEIRKIWLKQKRTLSSYEALKNRQLKAVQQREIRTEQKITDETSAGIYRRKRTYY